MSRQPERFDAVIIGGGFFGCAITCHLRRRGYNRISLIEREPELLKRASYMNQARIHSGYHYPRSFVTAMRSRVNFHRFAKEYSFAVKRDFSKLYAIAAKRSKISPSQFERFMREIDAPFVAADDKYRKLFDPQLIAAVYETEEFAFDATKLREHFMRELAGLEIDLRVNSAAEAIIGAGESNLVSVRSDGSSCEVSAPLVINCTYSAINYNLASQGKPLTELKHEFAEIALVEAPPALERIGVTLMDGPFFSFMPFPAEGCHSLSHVRYTPHGYLVDRTGEIDPYSALHERGMETNVQYMIADAARYMPLLREVRYLRSLFDVKTVLVKNEDDDSRPILFRVESERPRLYSVLGGKIDNIYDILEILDLTLNRDAAAS